MTASSLAIKKAILPAVLILCMGSVVIDASADEIKKPVSADMIKQGRSKAMELLAGRKFDEAVILLRELHEKAPQHHAFTELLADTYLRIREPEKAAELLEKGLKDFPGRTKYAEALGKAYLDMGQREKAVEVWHSILGENTVHPYDYVTIAGIEWEAGLFETAIVTLREGIRNGKYFQRAQQKLIKYETLLGDHDSAFRDGLIFLDAHDDPLAGNIDFLLESFRDSGRTEDHLSAVDSLAIVSENHRRFFTIVKGVLLVESRRYGEAEKVFREMELTDREMYFVLGLLFKMKENQGSGKFRDFEASLSDEFLRRNPESPVVPQVLLSIAESEIAAITEKGKISDRDADAVVSILDRVIGHRYGASYRKRAVLLKAGFLYYEMHRPAEALASLRGAEFTDIKDIRESARIEVLSLLAGGQKSKAGKRFAQLSSYPDSSIAALGRFAAGTLFFLTGEYQKSITELSGLAEDHPSSEWANDALDRAVLTKKAMADGKESLKIYSAAVQMELRGEFDKAAAALDSLIRDFPGSYLFAAAVYSRALLLEKGGNPHAAAEALLRFAEKYPLDDLAPKALEKYAVLIEAEYPDSASIIFGQVMERYPEYHFISRVREKYISSKKSKGGG
ncbi:MAG: tetratricopeptide repeat protein [Candidatus Krumholzibacteriota bacterium]|nr:tetratricopeptide repeat protein [Candidatus Krumholzibacteriota bacterium]